MTSRYLRFELHDGELSNPVQGDGEPWALGAQKGRSVAYVVDAKCLPALRADKELFIDRGRKHISKGLSANLLGQKKIALLDCSRYNDPETRVQYGFAGSKQFPRSLRELLSKHNKGISTYVIGVDADLFKELWSASAQSPANTESREGREIKKAPATSGAPPSLLERLRRNIERDILAKHGEEVRRAYLGASYDVDVVRALILLAGSVKDPVLIQGDNGTGKELVARGIHDFGNRRARPWVPLNCAAIPPMLLELELFGCVYTGGSLRAAKGAFEAADTGTLFLDEIGEMQADHQVKVLRAIETGKIRPIGAQREIEVNVRFIGATNRTLTSMVDGGQFRKDLYHRLAYFPIRTPSLDSHPEDIPILAQKLWRQATGDEQNSLPGDILSALQSRRWPGNVRQLKAILMQLRAWFGTKDLSADDLESMLRYEGYAESDYRPPEKERAASLRAMECSLHLRRVQEVIRTCEIGIQPILADGKMGAQRRGIAEALIHQRVDELERLSHKPGLFPDEETFSAAHSLAGSLRYFLDLLERSDGDANQYWNRSLAKEFKRMLAMITRQLDSLRRDF